MKKTALFVSIFSLMMTSCVTKISQEDEEKIQTCHYDGQFFYCQVHETCGKGICHPNTNDACGIESMTCLDTEYCQKGICICTATDALCTGLCCESGCVDPMTDASHCGACGHACKPGQACVDGECTNSCPSQLQACESTTSLACVDITSNWEHCGGCFQACPLPDLDKHVVYTDCIRGKCVPDCEWGWEDVNGDMSDGCEANRPSQCGNNIVELDELCDGTRLNDYTCASVLGEGSTGTLRCSSNCMQLVTDQCSQATLCGNGQMEGQEVCDREDFGHHTCETLVGQGSVGQLICAANCGKIDTHQCSAVSTCGNHILDNGEVCDGDVAADLTCAQVVGYGSRGTVKCADNCAGYDISSCTSASVCGNGIREAGEACDGHEFGEATCARLVGGGSTGTLQCNARCEIDKSLCSAPSTCGNGVADGNDVCDSTDLKGRTCASVVGAGSTGKLKCAENCASYDISECSAPASCGNGIVDMMEVCDGTRLNDETCASVVGKGSTGTLKCLPSCRGFDTSGCSALTQCGNEQLDAGEVCDGAILNNHTCATLVGPGSVGTVQCHKDCTSYDLSGCSAAALCGNGQINTEIGEVCDGEALGGQKCSALMGRPAEGTLKCASTCMFFDISDCRLTAYCGNGSIENKEICDLTSLAGRTCASEVGEGSVGTLRCNQTCSAVDTSGCSAPQTCGNGALEPHEVCDGTLLNGHTCEKQVGPGSEGLPKCNDTCTGYDNGTCSAAATCGDGKLDAGEDCDLTVYKNETTTCESYAPTVYASGALKCTSSCAIDTSACVKVAASTCGNGILEPGEACDGNAFGIKTCQTELGIQDAVGALKCSKDCQSILTDACEFCGDGKIDTAVTEDCDGNDWLVTSCVAYDPKTYSGGHIKCHASTCKFDTSECTRIETSRECDESATRCTETGLELCDGGQWQTFETCDENRPVCSLTSEQCLPSAWCNIQHIVKNPDGSIVGYSRILPGSAWWNIDIDNIIPALTCTSDLSIPVNNWPFLNVAAHNTNCEDCGDNLEFMTLDDPMTLPAGTHYCTFVYLFPDGQQYACLPHKHGLSEPIPVHASTVLSETTSYIVY